MSPYLNPQNEFDTLHRRVTNCRESIEGYPLRFALAVVFFTALVMAAIVLFAFGVGHGN